MWFDCFSVGLLVKFVITKVSTIWGFSVLVPFLARVCVGVGVSVCVLGGGSIHQPKTTELTALG